MICEPVSRASRSKLSRPVVVRRHVRIGASRSESFQGRDALREQWLAERLDTPNGVVVNDQFESVQRFCES